MTETNGRGVPVTLYIRVSTDAQAETGYSVGGQREELREQLRGLGREVVDEVVDPGEKRWNLDRPGINRLREIAASGTVEEVWAWRHDRYGESPWPEVLAIELEAYGVTLRSLDDGGEGEDAEILRVLRSAMAKKERKRITERSTMGKFAKARRGEISGSAFAPRYGFRYILNEQRKAVGYEVDPEKMASVRTIFESLADGESIRGVRRNLEQGGIPAPGGGRPWSTTTVRNIAQEDAYYPRTVEELEGMVSPHVLADLDPEQEYGICWFGKRRSYYTGQGNARKVELQPREKWVAIPISLESSGLDRATAERTRAAVKDNKSPSKAGDRTWDLSGVLKCAECGRNMACYRRRKRGGGFNHYYRCRPSSSLDTCSNRKSHPAAALEYEATRTFERYANRETMMALYDEAVARQEEQTGSRGILERRTALVERSNDLELERKGYLRQNARGVISDSDLDAMLAEVDEQRQEVAAELRATEDASAAVERLKAARSSLLSYDWPGDPEGGIHPTEYLTFAARPEEIQRVYRRFGARFKVSAEGELTMRLEIGPDPDPGRGSNRVATETHTTTLCPPAAATSRARLAYRCPATSAKSSMLAP